MPDYEKLTVVKLRDELTARGLPKAGLKAALVQRLIEADAQSEKIELAANEVSETSREDESMVKAVGLRSPRGFRDNSIAADDKPQSKDELEVADVPLLGPDGIVRSRHQTGDVQDTEQLEAEASDNLLESSKDVSAQNGAQREELPKEPDLHLSYPVQTNIGKVQVSEEKIGESTQTAITGDEVSEDSRKRKRRSQSPLPSTMDNAQKRLKADSGRPLVELPEDSEHPGPEERRIDVRSRQDSTYTQENEARTNGHECTNEGSKVAEARTCATAEHTDEDDSIPHLQPEAFASEEMSTKEKNPTPKIAESPMNPLSQDTRFKNLFTAPASLGPASKQSGYLDVEDKTVSPAVHPATSALYIRELMRPLKVESFRDHLVALASPPETILNPDVVTDFFLDSVRTHCLVRFETIAAASRVRSGLHDRVWPNERDRRQLWVDFVPEESLKKWIDIEQTTSTGRGPLVKRWEVVYENEGDSIKAYLQEVGSNSGVSRVAQTSRTVAGEGLRAPSGPRTSGPEPQSSQTRLDGGKGFKALDDFFKSTTAKPKLYYLPVSKLEADRRLAKLAAGRGGGRGNEMRRFSFEEGSLVDNGPEFGRGGYGRGGWYQGSYRGRGRAPREDVSRGDSWRDRRLGY